MRELKDSGIGWIGEIPKNWKTYKLQYICDLITDYTASGSFADLASNVQYLDEEDYAMLVRTADLSSKREMKPVYVNKHSYDYLKNSNLFGGELILPNVGSVGLSYIYKPLYERATLAPNSVMIRANGKEKYLYYLFNSVYGSDALRNLSNATTQIKFNKTQLRAMNVCLPPHKEMLDIVNFLDKKCSEIDALTKDIEKQIEVLEDYKKSVITEAVTKGLNPNVEMKDSGDDWIGNIPIDWDKVRIGRLFTLRNERNYLPENQVQLLSLYTGKGVFPTNESDYQSGNHAQTVEGYKIVKTDDIVVNIILAWMGALGISEYNGVCSPAYDVYIPNKEKVVPHYYHYVFRTQGIAGQCYRYGRGIMMMRWRTYSDEFKQINVPFPPIKIQKEIADYLDTKCKEIDKLISDKQKQLEILADYKKSLIYEYVTGKKEVIA